MQTRESELVKKAFHRFFIPSILSNAGLALGGLADCLFVGGSLGANGLAIIGFTTPVYLFFSLVTTGLAIGGSIHYAQALGEGRVEAANATFKSTLSAIVLFNIAAAALALGFRPQILRFLGVAPGSTVYAECARFLTAQLLAVPLLYLQIPLYYFVNADNSPRKAAVALVSSNAADLALTWLFVSVLRLGAVGSVYATLLGSCIASAVCLRHVARKDTLLSLRAGRFSAHQVLASAKTGFASANQYIYQMVTMLLFNNLMFGLRGEAGVAIFDIVYNISLFAEALMDGTGLAVQPMVSTYYGERNRANIHLTVMLALKTGALLSAGFGVLVALTAPWCCRLFGLEGAALLREGSWALRVYALSAMFAAANAVLIYCSQSSGNEAVSYGLQALRALLLPVSAGLLLSRLGGYHAFWWVFPVSEFLSLAVVGLMLLKKKVVLVPRMAQPAFTAILERHTGERAQVLESLEAFCEANQASAQQTYFVTLVVEEMCATMLAEGGQVDAYVQVSLVKEQDSFVLHMRDNNARRFNPFEMETDDLTQDSDAHNVMGMKIVKRKAKEFLYRQYAGFNTLVIRL